MADTVKTAVSIKETLFAQADELARQLNISRSKLFGLALEKFIESHKNQQLLEQINRAYSEPPDQEEITHLNMIRESHRRLVEDEW